MFPKVIDSSARANFVTCPRRFRNENVLGLAIRGQAESIDLHAGAAFARGLETTRRAFWERGVKPPACYLVGLDSLITGYGEVVVPEHKLHKSPNNLIRAFEGYWASYPVDGDPIRMATLGGKPAVEFTFALPLPVRNPDTGEPIITAGRTDWIGTYAGQLAVVDEKTCGEFSKDWERSWILRGQFMHYAWAAREYGYKVGYVVVRGIRLRKGGCDSSDFKTAIIPVKDYKIERWYTQFLRDVERMVECYKSDTWDYNFSDGCTKFGGCIFTDLCESKNEAEWIGTKYSEGNFWSPISVVEGV